jgi:hypothetical protein
VDASGNIVAADPKVLPWYLLYVNVSLCVESISRTKVSRKFLSSILPEKKLLEDLSNSGEFKQWESTDQLMLLDDLRHLLLLCSWHTTIPWM